MHQASFPKNENVIYLPSQALTAKSTEGRGEKACKP